MLNSLLTPWYSRKQKSATDKRKSANAANLIGFWQDGNLTASFSALLSYLDNLSYGSDFSTTFIAMTTKIKVFSDYVCPYCFLAEFPLKAATKEKDVEVEWMPFDHYHSRR
jgi:hypothetical protein